MLWKGRRQSDNIEDRRSESGGGFGGGPGGGDPFGQGGFRIPIGRAGGGGIKGIIILVILFFVLRFLGIDPMQILGQGGPVSNGGGVVAQQGSVPGDDEMKQFVATVLAETEDTWTGIFQSQGLTYKDPTLVLFSGSYPGGCGMAQKAMGPFYCPNDQTIYLDTSFFDELQQKYGASGDFAQDYVIAHEFGHHIQQLLGTSEKVQREMQQSRPAQANALSVRLELQADCYAGVWAGLNRDRMDPGDLQEGLTAAHAIGDDTLQKEAQGRVVPDSFTHGTSAERMAWLKRGIDTADPGKCDTFSGPVDIAG